MKKLWEKKKYSYQLTIIIQNNEMGWWKNARKWLLNWVEREKYQYWRMHSIWKCNKVHSNHS